MYATKVIPTEHKDIIHDVSFDFYGRRMATCSSDHTVKIWDLNENEQWVCTADWKTHSGSVWKVTWAHPEFGQVIATCSFDCTAVVWEEQVGEVNAISQIGKSSHWIQRASLVDSSNSVTDLKFSPRHLGLLLAMCYKDGVVRIYEAPDVMNLSCWSVQFVITCKLASASCISWNPSRSHLPMLAVGTDDPRTNAGGKVEIFEMSNSARKWIKIATLMGVTDPVHDIAFAPNVGRSRHLLAIASKDIHIMALNPTKEKHVTNGGGSGGDGGNSNEPHMTALATLTDHESQVWRVEWNLTGTVLSSTGDDGFVRLWKDNYLGTWTCISQSKGDGRDLLANGGQRSRAPSNSVQTLTDANAMQKSHAVH